MRNGDWAVRKAIALLLIMFPIAPAYAGNVTKEIISYKSISVGFSKNAANCNLTDEASLEGYLVEKLDELGLKENPNSQLHVALNVAGTTLGLLESQCATYTGLQFESRLRADNIVTDDAAVRAAVDRLGEFPIVLWTHSAFAVTTLPEPSAGGESFAAYDSVKEQLDLIVARYKEQRDQ